MSNVKTVKAAFNNLIVKAIDNKYRKDRSDSGLILNTGLAFTQETGQIEAALEERILLATVINAGPDCKFYKDGDEIYLDKNTLRPIPFQGKEYWLLNEISVMCKVE